MTYVRNKRWVLSTLYGLIAAATIVSCAAPKEVPRPDVRQATAGSGAVPKVADGVTGVDLIRIANSGTLMPAATSPLGVGPNDWGCTYDKKDGLMWEVKTTAGLRSQNHTFSWYDSNASSNGGSVGTANGGSCATNGRCDTEKFVQDVNAAGMCGHRDWRMPNILELNSLVLLGVSSANDLGYFPNTVSGYFWSASFVTSILSHAWTVGFVGGSPASALPFTRDGKYFVRLVRDGQ